MCRHVSGNLARRSLWAALSCLLTACTFETDGIDALIDDEESYILFPGKRLTQDPLHVLSVDVSRDRGPIVFGVDEEGALTIVRADGGSPCKVPSVEDYSRSLTFLPGDVSPRFVAVFREIDDDDFATITFVGYGCDPLGDPIHHAKLVDTRGIDLSGSLLRTNAEELIEFDLEAGEARVVTTDMSSIKISFGKVWTIEGGRLVVRDKALDVLHTEGTNVRSLTTTGDQLAYLDDDGVWLTEGEADPPRIRLDPEGCNLSAVGSSHVSYVTPCDDGQLVMANEEERFEIATNAVSPPLFNAGSELIAYLTDAEQLGRRLAGTLWSGPLEGEWRRIGERARHDSIELTSERRSRALVNWDGTRGDLVQWSVDEEPRVIASGASAYERGFQGLQLVEYDGTVGQRVKIDAEGNTEVFAEDSPTHSRWYFADDWGGQVFLSDFDGALGTVTFWSQDGGVEPIVPGVRTRDFDLVLWGDPAVIYRREYNSGSGTGVLGVHFPGSCDLFEVSSVSAWYTIVGSESGVLYTVSRGAARGVWYAHAQ